MDCSYKVGKLKNFIYLVKDLKYQTIDYKVKIVGGTVYKVDADLVTFNELENFSGRFRFNTSVSCTLSRVIDDNIFKRNTFKVVVEDLKGMLFLVSPEFDALYTSEFTITSDELSYKLIFTTQSNIPTKIVSNRITPKNEGYKRPCAYSKVGVDKLIISNKEIREEVHFDKCNYSKTFNGNVITTQIQFTIPVEDNEWHWNLIKFPNNVWDTELYVDNNEIADFKLFPQYVRQTQEELGSPDYFTITLKGTLRGTLSGFISDDARFRWIDTGGFICDSFIKYRKEAQLEYVDGTWLNTGEFRKGSIIERNSLDCGYTPGLLYKWESVSIDMGYECVGDNKYYQELQYISRDEGKTWTKTDVTRPGGLYQTHSIDCGYEKESWKAVEGDYICEPYDAPETWEPTDEYICKAVNI